MKSNLLTLAFSLIAFGSFAQGNNGLVAHWNFNGSANDVSGHGLNGVIRGATLTSGYNSIANTAYQFNGTSSHIDVANDTLLNMDSFSICALVKPTGFYSGSCQGNFIVCRGAWVNTPSDFYYLSFDDNAWDNSCSTASLSHEVFDVNCHASIPIVTYHPQWLINNDTVVLNTWYCVTATFQNDSVRLYVNGALQATVYFPDDYAAGSDSLSIGYDPASSVQDAFFNGAIDDIRLYNRPLSATEVSEYCDSAKMLPTNEISQINNVSPEIFIYPNPAHNTIAIQLAGNTGTNDIQLINTLGQVIADMKPIDSAVNLDISILPAGLYFIKAECSGQSVVRKVLKE